MNHAPTYTHLQVEAALCVWEELVERQINYWHRCKAAAEPLLISPDDPSIEAIFPKSPMHVYRETFGTVQMRHDSIDIGIWAEQVYALLRAKGYDELLDFISYDWEFIPRLLDQINWSTETRHMYTSDGKFPTPTVESGAYHYLLAYGWKV